MPATAWFFSSFMYENSFDCFIHLVVSYALCFSSLSIMVVCRSYFLFSRDMSFTYLCFSVFMFFFLYAYIYTTTKKEYNPTGMIKFVINPQWARSYFVFSGSYFLLICHMLSIYSFLRGVQYIFANRRINA